jgi:predicted phosphohydrolase
LRVVRSTDADAILIGGDIAEAHNLRRYLEMFDDVLARPIYFVLGNHDYYRGSIQSVRELVRYLCTQRPRLHYLSQCEEPIALTPGVALVGHDGWADGRFGDYAGSDVQLSDWSLIGDFIGRTASERLPLLEALADEAADHLRRVLPAALESHATAIVLTHVPPLREACWHEGRLSDDTWAPHFASKAVGDALLEVAERFPHRQIEVYCGHTHGLGKCRPLKNLRIFTGAAEYGRPHVQRVWEI